MNTILYYYSTATLTIERMNWGGVRRCVFDVIVALWPCLSPDCGNDEFFVQCQF